jgi:DNA polymerase-3 subunit delta
MEQTEKPLLPLYLFNGDDVLKQEMLLERLQERIARSGDLTLNAQTFSGRDVHNAQPLLDALNTMPFASPVRLVIIKDADALPKTVQEALAEYAARPTETTVAVLLAKKLAASTRLYKAIVKNNAKSVLDCSSKKQSELPALIKNMARSEGVDISIASAGVLLELVGPSTISLSTEVRKLSAIVKASGRNRIDDHDVIHNVARLAEPKIWDLTDALANRDTALCLRLIGRMKGYTAVGLLVNCTSRIREILMATTLKKRGLPVARTLGKQDWQIRAVMHATTLYSPAELESILIGTPALEQKMKSGGDGDALLREWIIGTCTKKTAASL